MARFVRVGRGRGVAAKVGAVAERSAPSCDHGAVIAAPFMDVNQSITKA